MVRHPHVVLDDAAVAGAGAEDVPLPGERAHARRVPGHRANLHAHKRKRRIHRSKDPHLVIKQCKHICDRNPSGQITSARVRVHVWYPCNSRFVLRISTSSPGHSIRGAVFQCQRQEACLSLLRSGTRPFNWTKSLPGLCLHGLVCKGGVAPLQCTDCQDRRQPDGPSTRQCCYCVCCATYERHAKPISWCPSTFLAGVKPPFVWQRGHHILAVHLLHVVHSLSEGQLGFGAEQLPHLSELARIPQLDGTVVGAHAQKVPPIPAHPLYAARPLPARGSDQFDREGTERARTQTPRETRGPQKRRMANQRPSVLCIRFEERPFTTQASFRKKSGFVVSYDLKVCPRHLPACRR